MGYIFAFLTIAVYLLIVVFMARLVLDWIQMFARYWRPQGFMLILVSFVYGVTDPPMNRARKYIKPLRLGGISLDLGFMLVLIGLFVAQTVLMSLTIRAS